MSNVIPLHRSRLHLSASRTPVPPRRQFPTILNVISFELPTPVELSSTLSTSRFAFADAQRLEEFFAWFGVEVDLDGPLDSLARGVGYFGSEIGAAAVYRVEYPQQFRALYPHWSGTQLSYVDAVVSANWTAARALVRNTPFLDRANAKMATRLGNALRLTRRLELAHG